MNELKIVNEKAKGFAIDRNRLYRSELAKFKENKTPKHRAGVMKVLNKNPTYKAEFDLYAKELGEENRSLIENAFYHWIEYVWNDEALEQISKGVMDSFTEGNTALGANEGNIAWGISQYAFLMALDLINPDTVIGEWEFSNEDILIYFVPIK